MSGKEIDRLATIEKVNNKSLKQKQAARILHVSTRQVRNLLTSYRKYGAAGLISKKRGNPSNKKYNDNYKQNAISLIKNNYSDFGPTLAKEYLLERHHIMLSTETTRKWMIESSIWKAKAEKIKVIHQLRPRRDCYGELIQIDGSPHHWFEDRGQYCSLLVFIDDATSKIQLARFYPAETTFAYFEMLEHYLKLYGKPAAYYSDKHSIFKVNIKEPESGNGLTQFGRAMRDLDIELFYANSPQAKGRVERANKTLQDRLIKWLRIEQISDIENANKRIDEFIITYNQKFAVLPKNPENVHRLIKEEKQSSLKYVFCIQTQRKVSKNLIIQYYNKLYQIQIPGKGYRLRQAQVIVCESATSEVTLLHNGQPLNYIVYNKNQYRNEVLSAKELPTKVFKIKAKIKPQNNHPWNIATRHAAILKFQRDQHMPGH